MSDTQWSERTFGCRQPIGLTTKTFTDFVRDDEVVGVVVGDASADIVVDGKAVGVMVGDEALGIVVGDKAADSTSVTSEDMKSV